MIFFHSRLFSSWQFICFVFLWWCSNCNCGCHVRILDNLYFSWNNIVLSFICSLNSDNNLKYVLELNTRRSEKTLFFSLERNFSRCLHNYKMLVLVRILTSTLTCVALCHSWLRARLLSRICNVNYILTITLCFVGLPYAIVCVCRGVDHFTEYFAQYVFQDYISQEFMVGALQSPPFSILYFGQQMSAILVF